MSASKKQPENANPVNLSLEEAERIAAGDNVVRFHQTTDSDGGTEGGKTVPNAFAGAAFRLGHS